MKKMLIIIIQMISFSLYPWSGDQASLACLKSKPNRDDIEDQYFSRNTYATTNEAQKATNKQAAIDRVKTIVRNNHDRDFTVTKLGDSLSDLVDFYGVATPRKLFPNYGDAAGTFGRLPALMDSWSDYMTAGAGILDPNSKLNFQNFGKSGNTTLDLLKKYLSVRASRQGSIQAWSRTTSAKCLYFISSSRLSQVRKLLLELTLLLSFSHSNFSTTLMSVLGIDMQGANNV